MEPKCRSVKRFQNCTISKIETQYYVWLTQDFSLFKVRIRQLKNIGFLFEETSDAF